MSTQQDLPPAYQIVTARRLADTAAGITKLLADPFVYALGPVADAPPAVLRQIAEEDARLCVVDGTRIFRWQTPVLTSLGEHLPCCSQGCADQLEAEHAGVAQERAS